MDNAQGNANKSNFAAETTAQLFGVHVASRPIWTPAYIRPDGKLVQQKCEITVYGNVRDGGEPNKFDLTIWGDQADSWARFCSVGKEMHITGLKMSRLHGSGIMDLNAARGAFYLISCMARL